MKEFTWIIGAFGVITTIVGVVIGTVKWLTASSERRIEKVFDEHKEKFASHDRAIRDNEKMIMETRDEIHRDYVRHDHLDKFTEEMRGSLGSIRRTIEAMARDLNRVIGRHKHEEKDST